MLHPELDKMSLKVFSNNGGWSLSLPNNEQTPTVLFNQSNSTHEGTSLVNRLSEHLAYEFRLYQGSGQIKLIKIQGVSIQNNVETPSKLHLVGVVFSPLNSQGRAQQQESFLLAHAIVLVADYNEEYFYRPTTQAKVVDGKWSKATKWYYGRNLYGTESTLSHYNQTNQLVFALDNKDIPVSKDTLSTKTNLTSTYSKLAEQSAVDELKRAERKQLEIFNFFTDILTGKIDVDSLDANQLTKFIDMNRTLFNQAMAKMEATQ